MRTTDVVDEVQPGFNSDAHALLQHPSSPQALQPRLVTPLHSLYAAYEQHTSCITIHP